MAWGGRTAPAVLALIFVLPASAHAAIDRAAVAKRLGTQAVVQVDPGTGTPRVLGKLNGTLTAPAAGAPATIADAYVRSHLADLGLTSADVASLGAPTTTGSPAGVTEVTWRQSVDGIPAASSSLRVNVARDGRVINVLGSPAHDLSADATTPKVSAGAAMGSVQQSVGHYKPMTAGAARGATKATSFGGGDSASLELYQRAGGAATLAWRVIYAAGDLYLADVDASSGALLKQVDLTRSAVAAKVWERFPGATAKADSGTQQTVDITHDGDWLAQNAGDLDGTNVHAYSDVDNDDTADTFTVGLGLPVSEEIPRNVDNTFSWTFQPVTGSAGCTAALPCSWSGGSTWTTNREQNGVQAFYYANQFHDHLAAAPIGFTAADGAFQGDDPLQLNTDDSANAGAAASYNNANMATPPDGTSPIMQMYLFGPQSGGTSRYVNGGDDAAILYHEYTHGLSSRLITDANGGEALDAAQAGAMGEAWSDWYAMDYLVDQGEEVDDPGVDGEVDMGQGTDGRPHTIRYQGLDCPVTGSTPAQCPGSPGTGPGGFTYADFGKIYGVPEVHADGEIWGETLWDIRDAFGSHDAEELITEAMRLSPPEPSFLDERNAIIQALEADTTLDTPANLATLWGIFAARGMGFYAATDDAADTHPIASFVGPPDASTPRGTITGTLTDADTGAPLADGSVGIAGLTTGVAPLTAGTDGNGRFTLTGVPQGDYPRLRFTAPGYYPASVTVSVTGGQTATANGSVRRNWASASGLATVTSNHHDYLGCEADAAIDQSLGTGWSADNPNAAGATDRSTPTMVVTLPAAVDISSFGLDPDATCGDDINAMTDAYRLETTTDPTCSAGWQTSVQDTFGTAQAGVLTPVTPADGTATAVTCVRLSLLSAESDRNAYIDFTELAVFGAPTGPHPSGSVSATASGLSARFTASMSEAGATISRYRWDFGDGSTATTSGPQTDHTYAAAGTYTVRVTATDDGGRTGSATVAVTVTGPAATATPTPTPSPTPTPFATAGPTPVPKATPGPVALAKPSFALPSSGSRGEAAFTVRCAAACSTSATLVVDAKTKRKLGLATLGTASAALLHSGSRKLTVKLSAKARRALNKHRLKSVTVTLKVTSHYKGVAAVTASRRVRIRV